MKRDLRAFARQTNTRLVGGGLVLLFAAGLLLIFLLYGPGAALTGLLCLMAAVVPVGLIAASLLGLEWVVKRGRPR